MTITASARVKLKTLINLRWLIFMTTTCSSNDGNIDKQRRIEQVMSIVIALKRNSSRDMPRKLTASE